MYAFSMFGRQGDVIWSLWYCRQRSEGRPFDYYLQTNVPDAHDPGGRKVFMTRENAEYIASIMREQPYIRNLTIGDAEYVPASDISRYIVLDLFRQLPEPYTFSEIRYWTYRLSSLKPVGLDRPVLTVPESDIEPTQKILICFTPRYKPAVSPMVLAPFRDHLLYVGLKSEYDKFCADYFDVDYRPVASGKEILQLAQKSAGYIGNISGQYALMEAAAIPRLLCLPPGGGDVRCYCPNGIGVMDKHKLLMGVESLLG